MVADCSLRDAAVCGNEETFRRLLQDGQDANSVLGALILGATSFDELDISRTRASASGRLSILSYLLETRCLSLYTLNASHASLKGLTPLGMATYLDHLDFVTILLEKGDGLVLVDGTDSQKATPIMYAARDEHTDVLKYLINKGARVTCVDWQHRSVLFYSTASPQCLWECELNLRLQRAELLLEHEKKRQLKLTLQQDVSEYDSLACLYQQHTAYPLSPSALQSSVQRLVASITSSDLSAVHSLLFPSQNSSQSSSVPVPVLVNLPDENGWSPIHYCVASPRPSSAILDALFLAGADLALYTADNCMTPLHALARFGGSGATTSFRLYAFIVHLVRDLGAPLDAADPQGETCIHVAARHGRCADILMALLECDESGRVARLRNNDGQTAYDVAKPYFCSIFEQDDGSSIRSGSVPALRTIKPSISSASLGTSYSSSSCSSSSDGDKDLLQGEEQFPRPISREKESLRVKLTNPSEAQQFIDRLGYVLEKVQKSETRRDSNNALGLLTGKSKQPVHDSREHIDGLLKQAQRSGRSLLELNRQLIDAELDDLHAAQEVHAALEQLIVRLEERALAIEEEGSQTPSLSSYRRLSEAPSLVASGSSASVTSLTDLAALVTPTCSPRTSLQGFNASKKQKQTQAENTQPAVELPEEAELDFACALAAGSVTRRRRASSLSGIFALGDTDIDMHCPLEEGVNLVSIPPTRVPEVQDVIVHVPPESRVPSPDGSNSNSLSPTPPSGKVQQRESWLDPYVRRANSDILKAHLANLLEIEQMLFGAEDKEMEEAPSPGSVSDEASEDRWSWREGIDSLQENIEEGYVQTKDEGNFLDMFGAEEVGNVEDAYAPFLDLLVQSEWDEEDDGDCDSRRASTVKPSTVHKRYSRLESLTAFDILGIAKRELFAVEESMLTACRSIETAQRYVNQAEHLMSDICQRMKGSVQAASLASFASYDESGMLMRSRSRSSSVSTVVLSPAPGPHGSAYVGSRSFPQPSSSSSSRYSKTDHRPSMQSLRPVPSMPSLSSHYCASPSPSPSPLPSAGAAAALTDDIKYLRHLLVRKIPIWLDATSYDVDKAATWVGIVQGVVRNVARMRL